MNRIFEKTTLGAMILQLLYSALIFALTTVLGHELDLNMIELAANRTLTIQIISTILAVIHIGAAISVLYITFVAIPWRIIARTQ